MDCGWMHFGVTEWIKVLDWRRMTTLRLCSRIIGQFTTNVY